MLIGVVSDTHDNLTAVRRVKAALVEGGAEFLVHLGDFTSPFSFKEIFSGFESRGIAVFGNNDGDLVLMGKLSSKMGVRAFSGMGVVELGGLRVFLMHGYEDQEFTLSLARAVAMTGKYDAVLFGHTHSFHLERCGDVLVLNPGEGGGWLTGEFSAALLDAQSKTVKRVKLAGSGI